MIFPRKNLHKNWFSMVFPHDVPTCSYISPWFSYIFPCFSITNHLNYNHFDRQTQRLPGKRSTHFGGDNVQGEGLTTLASFCQSHYGNISEIWDNLGTCGIICEPGTKATILGKFEANVGSIWVNLSCMEHLGSIVCQLDYSWVNSNDISELRDQKLWKFYSLGNYPKMKFCQLVELL